jgi:hypothetical protein
MRLRKGAWKLIALTVVLITAVIALFEICGVYGYFVILALGFVLFISLILTNKTI